MAYGWSKYAKSSKRRSYSKAKGSAAGKKFFKCRSCYSSGKWCSHSKGASKGTYKKSASKTAYRKKTARTTRPAEKVDVPVLDAAQQAAIDQVPMNGVRARGVHLTEPYLLKIESKKFAGQVCWRGVTEDFSFELNGEGPFLHRRVLFSSTVSWSFPAVRLVKTAVPSSVWTRPAAVGLTDDSMAAELRRLFGQNSTVRNLMFGKVEARGVTVIEDRRVAYEGKSSGARRSFKYWNGFGKSKMGVTLKYDLSEDGTVMGSLVDGSNGQHLYVLDLFQYGISGLDLTLPGVGDISKKRPSADSVSSGASKRYKFDESVDDAMEGMGLGSALTGNAADDLDMVESAVRGVVRVISNMKLYWYEPT